MRAIIASVLLAAISGCASQITVTTLSDPPGAAVIQNGQLLGYTPTYLVYPKSVFKQSGTGCGETLPLTFRWASGVEHTETLRLCKHIGAHQQITILRPEGPGRQQDIEIGVAVQQQALLQQQQRAAEQREALELLRVLEALSNTEQQSTHAGNESGDVYAVTCTSDFSCSTGYKCVKAPLSTTGTCLKNVDSFRMPKYELPDLNSVGPNMNLEGQCRFDTDCPIGFSCDPALKACVTTL